MGEFVRLNIAIKLPQDIANKAIELSKSIQGEGNALFVLDGANYHPHATLYSPEFPTKNIDTIYEQLIDITDKLNPFTVPFTKFEGDSGYIGIGLEKTEEIVHLHTTVVEAISPLREGRLREKYTNDEYRAKLSAEQLHNIDTLGYPAILNLFDPHITIIRFDEVEVAERLMEELSWDIEDMTIETIGVFTMGENGTCKELLKEFKVP